ncbi:hypothetical protein [Paraburkholderia panacisoli]|nr:hypothetical protein [Paraburkholderia panacisoli]
MRIAIAISAVVCLADLAFSSSEGRNAKAVAIEIDDVEKRGKIQLI